MDGTPSAAASPSAAPAVAPPAGTFPWTQQVLRHIGASPPAPPASPPSARSVTTGPRPGGTPGLGFRRAREAFVHIATAADRAVTLDEPVYLLGESYRPVVGAPAASESDPDPVMEALKEDFASRILLSYRTDVEPFPAGSYQPFTSDVGWGCMIRSAQMLLANALVVLECGRAWRASSGAPAAEAAVVAQFGDTTRAPFALARIAGEASKTGAAAVGSWHGPTTATVALSRLVRAVQGHKQSMAEALETANLVPSVGRLVMCAGCGVDRGACGPPGPP